MGQIFDRRLSGSAEAAVGLDRNFLGCDLDPEYVEIAKRRIKWIRQHGLQALATAPPEKKMRKTKASKDEFDKSVVNTPTEPTGSGL